MARTTTEFFIPVSIGVESFKEAVSRKFLDAKVDQRAVINDRIIVDLTIPSEHADQIKVWWEQFARQHNMDTVERPSRFCSL